MDKLYRYYKTKLLVPKRGLSALQADAEIISVKFLDHEKTDGKLGNLSGNSVHLA